MKKGTRISLENLRIDFSTRKKILERFARIASAFETSGALPPEARSRLVNDVAFVNLRAACSEAARQVAPSPNELAAGADYIARKARQLRTGLNPKQRERLLAKTQRMGVDAKKAAAERLASLRALNIDATLFARLLDIEHIAEKIALEQRQRLRPRNKRNVGRSPLEELQYALFDIYAKTRSQYPKMGPAINLNNAVTFVRAVLKAVKVDPGTEKHLRDTVRGALRRWRASRTN